MGHKHSALKPATESSGDKAPPTPNLPNEVLNEIASWLGSEAHRFFRTTEAKELLSPTLVSRLGPHLLKHVKDGNVEKVMEMLSKHPELIDYKGNVSDTSGYEYKDINALELALKLPERSDLAVSMYEILFKAYQGDNIVGPYLTETFHSGFREHVAKGNQDAAEAMLKRHPELLTSEGLITDYSGRIFNCTAYEYAYWAKDTHMRRMLEKYMDNNVRAEMLKRIKIIESPDGGLDYTQDGEEHRSAHFNLTPLKDALQHYMNEYNKRPDQYDADWAVLNKIWIEEVGGAQRDVPAHIAHEYCHPDRSFKDVTRDKSLLDPLNPHNLKRCLKPFKWPLWPLSGRGLWFYPGSHATNSGLGFSFGILSCNFKIGSITLNGGMALGVNHQREIFHYLCSNSEAVKAIDEARTQDLKQSLKNLSQPGAVQSSQSHGI